MAPEIETASFVPSVVGAVAKETATSTTVSKVRVPTEPKIAAVTESTVSASPSADV